jgi:hypothetical protein
MKQENELNESVQSKKELSTILETSREDQLEGGEAEEVKVAAEPSQQIDVSYPSHAWFLKWRESLLLPNIKVSIQHTYSKAMAYRN